MNLLLPYKEPKLPELPTVREFKSILITCSSTQPLNFGLFGLSGENLILCAKADKIMIIIVCWFNTATELFSL